jgi:hypothetical protein
MRTKQQSPIKRKPTAVTVGFQNRKRNESEDIPVVEPETLDGRTILRNPKSGQ